MGQHDRERQDGLIPGTLDMLILKTVSGEPLHGYAIAQSIQRTSADVLHVEEGALYPALHRLEVRGLLKSMWGVSDTNRRAKYYTLTADGRRELQRSMTSWSRVAAAVSRVIQTA
jgi:transcriptional regulator